MQKIRWGILGTGNIARKFAHGLSVLADAELVGVGSRNMETANAFGDLFNIPERYSSYEELAKSPSIDAVYIGTPHNLHAENSLMCLNAGKAVICEKPFAINARQAQEVINVAREKQIFLMEAMWTRYMPVFGRLREILNDGTIGDIRMINADFGFRTNFDPEGRLFDPNLGGGALLDVGIYPVSLASMIFGSPTTITAMAHLGETGVDEQSAMILGYDSGQLALLSTAVRTQTPHVAYIMGTKGRIEIHAPWWYPERLSITIGSNDSQTYHLPYEDNGYNYEAAELMRCLRAGELESPVMPLDETLSIMETMDEIRRQWGLRYPME